MESRSDNKSERERVDVSDKKKPLQSETVDLVLQRDLKLKIKGPVSGKQYLFAGAGAVVPVNKEDVDKMLEKSGGMCCEGSGVNAPQSYFVKA